ncbi:MAG TPA: hypothetical protein VFM90_01820 [Cyclobacteriaceae bacterium]|nr:hypothetical protein [Cyclobacteriaceae bacterium]
MKVQATHYKGIDFICFDELPTDQQLLLHTATLERIHIMMDGKVRRDCISYKEYSNWYASVFLHSAPAHKEVNQPAEPVVRTAPVAEAVAQEA